MLNIPYTHSRILTNAIALNKILAKRIWRDHGLQAHIPLGALDISRVDIRLDMNGNPQLMEINPLPGLTPGYSDICIQAAVDGIRYEDFILEILYLAAGRWELLEPSRKGTKTSIVK